MMELFSENGLSLIGGMAAIVSIITELLKNKIPIPTKALAIIISVIVVMAYTFMNKGFSIEATVNGFVSSFIVAFVSTYGWESFKELWDRSKYPKVK